MTKSKSTRNVIVSLTLAEAEALDAIGRDGLWARPIQRGLDKIAKALAFVQTQSLPQRKIHGTVTGRISNKAPSFDELGKEE